MLVENQKKLSKDLSKVLNVNGIDAFLNIPDYAIADFIVGIIVKMDDVNKEKEKHEMLDE